MSKLPGAESRSREPALPLEEPSFLAFLPMLYVAWADGDLDADEMRAVCAKASAVEGLERSCQDLFGRWLDPDRPPSARELQGLLVPIRRAAPGLTKREKRTLADLGVELARAGGHHPQAAERRALEEIEAALGLAGVEAARRVLVAERPLLQPVQPEPAFDVSSMTRLLDGEYRDVRQQVRALLSQPEFRYRYGLDQGSYRARVFSWAHELAAKGFGALALPREYGGRDDLGAFIAAAETIAFHDLSLLVKYGVQFGLFAGSIYQLGTKKHHDRYLWDAGNLELPGCFAMTETGHGSNVHDLETVARFDRQTQELVIHTPHDGARKDYIGNAALHGRMATVFAQLETDGQSYGVHAFLVPIRDPDGEPCAGVRIEDDGEKLGLNGVDNGRLWFDHVRIPRENLLDRFAQLGADGSYSSPIASPSRRFFTMLGTLIGGRVSIALAASSATKSALTIAVRYASRRRQFGPAGEAETLLLDYLTHQRRLLPRLATTYALDFALKHLVERYLESPVDDRREVEALAAGLKAMSTWHATETIQTCREACGGQGYLAVNRFAALKADTDVFNTFEGDNTVLLQLVAKGLLTGYRQQFGEMSLLGLIRHLAGQAATVVTELNPIVTRRTDEAHLRDREFQLAALRWREQHLLASVARRLKKRIIDGGMDSFQAVIVCQDHLVETAKAHVERIILERFAAGIDRCSDPRLAEILGTLCDLFVLWRIELDRGWFLEHGYIDGAKAKAIRKLVNKLCNELRDQAVPLVDAFGIPDACLAAPIAT